jgi:RNA polymerase sigma-70 factor (ECF subfamily)
MTQQDKSSLEALFKTHYQSLCKTAYRILRDKDLAEDIVQDVFCKLWEKNITLGVKDSILPYLHKTVINRSLNSLRGQINRNSRENKFGNTFYEERNFTEDLLFTKDLTIKINQIIDELPPACRMVFVLNRFEHLKYKEISEKLNISVKTVENQMVKALKHIRANLISLCLTIFVFFFN